MQVKCIVARCFDFYEKGAGGLYWQTKAILCDRGPWYGYALKKLGLNYKHEKFGLRNAICKVFSC